MFIFKLCGAEDELLSLFKGVFQLTHYQRSFSFFTLSKIFGLLDLLLLDFAVLIHYMIRLTLARLPSMSLNATPPKINGQVMVSLGIDSSYILGAGHYL